MDHNGPLGRHRCCSRWRLETVRSIAVRLGTHMELAQHGETHERVTLQTLPTEVLNVIVETCSVHTPKAAATLCALSATSRGFSALLDDGDGAAWAEAGRQEGLYRCGKESINWRAILLSVRSSEVLLQQLALRPPTCSSTPHLRCQAWKTLSGPDCAQLRIAPFSSKEREWLLWFNRFGECTLHLEDVRFAATRVQALHMHDGNGRCVACAVQDAASSTLPFLSGTAVSERWRLLNGVSEFRQRLRVVQRLFVLCEASPSHAAAIKRIFSLHPSVCLRHGAGHDSCSTPPPMLLVQCSEATLGQKLSIASAMGLVGRLAQKLVAYDEACDGALRAIVFVTASMKALDVFEKAVRSISFKSHLAIRNGL